MCKSRFNAMLCVMVAICAAVAGSPDAAHGQSIPSGAFVTTWKTTAPGESITIPARGTYTIDWGDGTVEEAVSGSRSHRYDSAGTHTVRISDGITRIQLQGQGSVHKLVSIDQWGTAQWTSMHSAFRGASNMVYNAVDTPDLSRVSDASHMFRGASSFNGDLSTWDVSSVTNMHDMFRNANAFNQPLSSWNVSSVTDMAHMFHGATSFNGDISGWDVSSVAEMRGMFHSASSFNQPLNSWDVSSVASMYGMFSGATSFNRPLDSWDVSSVTYMRDMFRNATSFNQPRNSWDVSSVASMYGMFSGASSFNQPLNSWEVSSVTHMDGMFSGAASFNQPLNSWDLSSVRSMRDIFLGASAFEQHLGNWYIVLDDTSIEYGDAPGAVGRISAQSGILDRQNPVYGIGPGGDSDAFELGGTNLVMKEVPTKDSYTVTITATTTEGYGTGNSRTYTIDVSGLPTYTSGSDFVTTWKTTAPGERHVHHRLGRRNRGRGREGQPDPQV